MIEPDAVATITSFDGTRISYQVFGSGPTILFGNGIGVSWPGVRLQLAHLRQHHRVVCWDHRGIAASDPPGSGGFGVDAHARDALAVSDALDLERPGYLGWSMGVQVGFEVLRQRADAFARMACIGGVAGSPFRAAMPLPGLSRVLPAVLDRLARLAPHLSPVLGPLIRRDGFFRAACLAGYVRPNADREVFMGMVRAVAGHDHWLYLAMLAELGRHQAEDLLPRLSLPVLFLAGGQDHMTPRRELERLARLVRNGSVHTVHDASHFVTIEAPDEVNRVLAEFFAPLQ